MKPFYAKYRGPCGECEVPIEEGDLVVYDEWDTLVHEGCGEG